MLLLLVPKLLLSLSLGFGLALSLPLEFQLEEDSSLAIDYVSFLFQNFNLSSPFLRKNLLNQLNCFLGVPLLLVWHLSDTIIAEVFVQFEVFVFLFPRLETQTGPTEVVVDTFEPFLMSWAPAVLAPIS